jgi:hypothetical protein
MVEKKSKCLNANHLYICREYVHTTFYNNKRSFHLKGVQVARYG